MIIYNNTIIQILQDLESRTKLKFPEKIKEQIINTFLIFEKEPTLVFEYKLAYTKAKIKINGVVSKKPIKKILAEGKSYKIEYLDGTVEKKQARISISFEDLNYDELFNIFKEIK